MIGQRPNISGSMENDRIRDMKLGQGALGREKAFKCLGSHATEDDRMDVVNGTTERGHRECDATTKWV